MYNADGWLRSCFEHPNVINAASDLCKISRDPLLLTMLVNFGSDQMLPAVLIQQQQLPQFDLGDLNRRSSRLLLANMDPRVPGLRKSSAAIRNLASVKRRKSDFLTIIPSSVPIFRSFLFLKEFFLFLVFGFSSPD